MVDYSRGGQKKGVLAKFYFGKEFLHDKIRKQGARGYMITKHNSIRKALISSILALTMLPMLFAMAVSVALFHHEISDRIRQENLKVAQTVSTAVELFMSRPVMQLKFILLEVDQECKDSDKCISDFASSLLTADPIFESILFIDRDGNLVSSVGLDRKNSTGAAAKPNYSSFHLFKKVKASNQISWSEPFVSLKTGESVISVAIPWRNGMVLGTMNLSYLCKLVEPTKTLSKAYAFIVSPEGKLVAHPDRALVGEKEAFISLPQIKAGFSGKEGTYNFKIGDRDVIGSVLPFKYNDWVIVSVHDRENAFTILYRLELILAAFSVVVLATSLWLAFKRIERISAPLLSLSGLSKQIASGEVVSGEGFNAGYSEIDVLFDNFMTMSVAIQEREQSLQARNRELIATEEELRHKVEEYLKTHDALVTEKTKLEAILASMGDGLSIQDTNYRVLLQNDAHRALAGDAAGNFCYKVYNNNDKVCDQCPLKQSFADGEKHQKFISRRINDQDIYLEISAYPLRNHQGEIVGGIEVVRDITEQQLANEEIRRLNHELEERVIERTAELEMANQELESFSYSVSHDLRSPLRHISSFSSIIETEYSSKLDDQGRQYISRIIAGCNKMGNLIDDLLELSHISRREIRNSRINLSDIFSSIAATLIESDPNRNVSFRIEEGLEANGDERLIEVLLNNLLGNAWKYTALKPEAVIEFGRQSISARQVYFVKDNGAGFNKEFADKLFAPFHRLHGSEFEGTGIGLAIAQRVVHRHGGKIWADAVEGEGATFYFTLKS